MTNPRIVRYISHPQVVIDPAVPVPHWPLNATGQARVAALAASGALAGTQAVFSSTETKALNTAEPLAAALGLSVQAHEEMGENDRSATGFLPGPKFEQTADAFFAAPAVSVRGWETAQSAQQRIVAAITTSLMTCPNGDVLFVGHGAVGTLLYCHLKNLPISRTHDQGTSGGGCFLQFNLDTPHDITGWQPIELLYTDDASKTF